MQKPSILVATKGILVHNKKVLLVQREPNDTFLANCWEFPGGKVEFGETVEDALKREFLEETGISVTVENILYENTFITKPTYQIIMLTYLVSASSTEVTLSFEHQDYKWVQKEEMLACINPEIASKVISPAVLSLLKLS